MLRKVPKESTTKGIWDKLESLFMAKSVTNRLLSNSVYDVRLEEGNSLKAHLDEFCTLIVEY